MDRNCAPDPIYEDFSSQLQYNTIEDKKLIDVKTEIPSSNAKNNNVQEFKFTSLSLENLSASENTYGVGLENDEANKFISKPIYQDESSSEDLQINAVESESSVDFKTCSIENSTYQYSQDTVHSTKILTVVETTRDICRKEEIINADGLSTEILPTKIEITEHGVSLEHIEALENIYRDYSENVTDKSSKVNQKSVELVDHSVEKEKEPVKKTRGQKRKVQVNTADICKNYSENVIDKSSKGSQKSIGTPEHNVEKEQGPLKKTRGREKKILTNALDKFVCRTKNKIKTGPTKNISMENFEKLFVRLDRIDISDKLHSISNNSKNLDIFSKSYAVDNLEESSKPGAGKEKILGINLPEADETIVGLKREETNEGISKTKTNLKTVAFRCSNCNKVMENDKHYRQHLSLCNNFIKLLKTYQEEFQCYHCNKVMKQRRSLQNHITQYHTEGERRYHCDHCTYETHVKSRLKIHVYKVHVAADKEEFQCYHCNKVMKQRISLQNHITQYHTEGERRYHCDHCTYETNLKGRLNTHVYKVHVPADKKPTFKCKLCPHQTTDKALLNLHVKRVHLKIIKKKKCEQCDWEGDAARISMHFRKVHLDEEYFCDKCDYKTKTKGDMVVHQIRHNKIKEFTCPHCPYQAHFKNRLDEHIKTHEYGFTKCPKCFKLLKENAMKRHLQLGHKEKVKKKCPECGKEVGGKSLRQHMLTHSEADRKQKCPECSYSCVGSYYLRKHIRDYHEDKIRETFTCYHCNKVLAERSCLISHLKAVHTVQKPCKCHICGTMLKSKMYLNAHLRRMHVHNDKRFECDLCPEDNRFKTKKQTSLKWHRVLHLKKNEVIIFKCEYCSYETRVPKNLNRHVAQRHPKKAKKFKR